MIVSSPEGEDPAGEVAAGEERAGERRGFSSILIVIEGEEGLVGIPLLLW
jgi:hypothetical protein